MLLFRGTEDGSILLLDQPHRIRGSRVSIIASVAAFYGEINSPRVCVEFRVLLFLAWQVPSRCHRNRWCGWGATPRRSNTSLWLHSRLVSLGGLFLFDFPFTAVLPPRFLDGLAALLAAARHTSEPEASAHEPPDNLGPGLEAGTAGPAGSAPCPFYLAA